MNKKLVLLNRLTTEAALWVVVVASALALRLVYLDLAPLGVQEAREATLAWRAAQAQGFPTADYTPLLLATNGLLFTLFGASDVLARLMPALCGALLVATPLLFRQHLGRIAALVAGSYLAVSPTALIASRQVTGASIAATGAMACIGGLARFSSAQKRGWLILAAIGLALGVTSGATAYGLFLPLAVAWVFLSHPWLRNRNSDLRDSLLLCFRPQASQFFLAFTLALFGLSTGLGWNLSGLGAIGGLVVDWLGRFRPSPSPVASPLTLLIVYELLGLTLGIGGLAWGLRRRSRLAAVVGMAGALGALLLAVMPSRVPSDLLWVVLPLSFLTGLMVEYLFQDWPLSDVALRSAYAALVLVLWGYGYLMVARYAAFADQADLALAVIVIVAQVLLATSFGLALGLDAVFRTATAATGIALLALLVSVAWGVAYGHPADPRETLLSEPTAEGVRDLVETLHDLSWHQTGMPTTLEFTFAAAEDSVLAWYLRDFTRAHRVDELSDAGTTPIGAILVTTGRGSAVPLGLDPERADHNYAGQDFALQRRWAPRNFGCRFWEKGCRAVFDWFLFRESPSMPEPVQWATLWRQVEIASSP